MVHVKHYTRQHARVILKHSGLNQQEFHDLTGISKTAIRKWKYPINDNKLLHHWVADKLTKYLTMLSEEEKESLAQTIEREEQRKTFAFKFGSGKPKKVEEAPEEVEEAPEEEEEEELPSEAEVNRMRTKTLLRLVDQYDLDIAPAYLTGPVKKLRWAINEEINKLCSCDDDIFEELDETVPPEAKQESDSEDEEEKIDGFDLDDFEDDEEDDDLDLEDDSNVVEETRVAQSKVTDDKLALIKATQNVVTNERFEIALETFKEFTETEREVFICLAQESGN